MFVFINGSGASIAKHDPNQDAFILNAVDGLFAVFDGVSGSEQGQVASNFAAETFSERCKELPPINKRKINPTREWVCSVLQSIHDEILLTESKSQTTASVIVICNHPDEELAGVIINVGDSRIYSWNIHEPRMIQLTKDDNAFPDRRLDHAQGKDEMTNSMSLAFRFRHVITRSIGHENLGDLVSNVVFLENLDGLLLTTDGVHDNLGFSKIFDTVLSCVRNPDGPSGALVITELAKEESENLQNWRSKKDDITAVFIEIDQS